MIRRAITTSLALVLLSACGAYTRFALRPPIWRDDDDRSFAPAPRMDEEQDVANTLDVTILHPLSHGLLLEAGTEARDVSALDEVPDSSWFTNRTFTPASIERGSCDADEPTPPFTITSTKVGGTTAGFTAQDASGRRYVMKLDGLGPRQPEMSTASDAIVSRLYWGAGFNVPCNRVVYVSPSELVFGSGASERLATGERRPLTREGLDAILARATLGADGLLRVSASLFIDGDPLGTWRAEGTRRDDPNDRIPHEDRRELRGERFLAAWVAHWDSRGPQSYDAFEHTSATRGHVIHYFLDFSDSLGGTPTRTPWAEPRMGHETVSDLPEILEDVFFFGIGRDAWDEVRVDPRYPNLGFFDDAHFDPMGFAPQTPLSRWERAQPADLGWMARRLAHFDRETIRSAVRTGRLSDPLEEERLVDLLVERRDRVLRVAFARSSPIGGLALIEDRLCGVDLALRTGISTPAALEYAASVRGWGDAPARPATLDRVEGWLCVELAHEPVPELTADGDAARYRIVEIVRTEGGTRTVLRAHLYDLGPGRGFAWGGIERP